MILLNGEFRQIQNSMEDIIMLVLTRKMGESLIIGDNITVTMLELNGGQVRVGVDAPREISVHREEVKKRIDRGELKPLN